MEFTCKQLVDSFAEKYIEGIAYKTREEWFAIFDIIQKEYKEHSKCLICEESTYSREGVYRYNSTKIACENGIFYVGDETITFIIQVNYCPICGKKLD